MSIIFRIPRVQSGKRLQYLFMIMPPLRVGDKYELWLPPDKQQALTSGWQQVYIESGIADADQNWYFLNGRHWVKQRSVTTQQLIITPYECPAARNLSNCPLCSMINDLDQQYKTATELRAIMSRSEYAVNVYFPRDHNPDYVAGRVMVVNLVPSLANILKEVRLKALGSDPITFIPDPVAAQTNELIDDIATTGLVAPCGVFKLVIENVRGWNSYRNSVFASLSPSAYERALTQSILDKRVLLPKLFKLPELGILRQVGQSMNDHFLDKLYGRAVEAGRDEEFMLFKSEWNELIQSFGQGPVTKPKAKQQPHDFGRRKLDI